MKKLLLIWLSCCLVAGLKAQDGNSMNTGNSNRNGSPRFNPSSGARKDTIGFEHRDDAKDSISISFRYLDSIRSQRFDTSINDFYKYYIVPYTLQYLGNSGAAGYSLIFTPNTKTGMDDGFHAFDAYKFTIDKARFFKTTRPFTQLNYQLASGKEQQIKVIHTQSPRPNVNFGFEYRLLNAPGFFVNQSSNHSNYRLFSSYQGKRKRYANYFFLQGNSIKNSENGGMVKNSYLDTPIYNKRFAIPVNLAFNSFYTPNPFNSFVSTGNKNKEFTFFLRQSYDLGKKDSVEINDSTTEYLFYPKLRLQHTFTYSSTSNTFIDTVISGRTYLDSAIYQNWYDTSISKTKKLFILTDAWKTVSNDFSLLQFPDTKNPGQYLLAGARMDNISGSFSSGSRSFFNLVLHGEYRNKTRNKKWDILARGEFYLSGFNSGDYSAFASLSRYFSKRWGNVTLQFHNVNRTPSFVFNSQSSFNFHNEGAGFGKENITVLKATAENPFINLSAANYLLTNYSYFTGYYTTAQFSRIINILQLGASKKIRLTRRWNLYSEVVAQLTDASSPIRLPLVFSRNRLAYEGLFFKNLQLSTGLEVKYYTPFKAYDYSPMMGQFFPQDSITLHNRPDIHAFLHFRIKSFTGYIRAENLNSLDVSNGFGFTKSNFAAPHYIYPGYQFRFGIQWNFVN